MKKLYLLFAISASVYSAGAQTLITYGNNTVSKDEFWRAYNKNKPVVTDKEKSVREYVDLYTNFKLKVKAAYDARIDTLQQIQYDIQNFRNQVMENYLSDNKGLKRLEDEAFERSQKDVHVLHFSIPIGPDSAQAAAVAKELYQKLNSEKGTIVLPDGVKQSDLGFITAFTVPYEYENIIYNLKTGEVSEPKASKTSWHLFKVLEQKPGAGKWKVAQILFTFPPEADNAMKERIRRRADSVYNLLQSGMSFAAAAKIFSDDKLTYLTEGELPEFNAGKYSYAFESRVFNLKKDGDLSKPFETAFGYHIVKRLGQKAVVTNRSDETNNFELKQKIMADERINVEREKFTKEIVIKTGIKKSPIVNTTDLYRFADTLMKDPSVERTESLPISKKPVLLFTDKSTVPGSEWLKFVRDYRGNTDQDQKESNEQLWNKFVSYSAVEYYKNHLENYNSDFKFQMLEFKEGNMLFEIMERNVWNKAVMDAAGLQKYYDTHKEKYKWAASADVIVFNCSSAKIAEETMTALKAGADWKKLSDESNATIQADSGRYELTQVIGAENIAQPANGMYTGIINGADGTASFVYYLHIYPADMQRNFEEARGLVINDYQGVLEQEWLNTLKQKYPVKLNESVLSGLIK